MNNDVPGVFSYVLGTTCPNAGAANRTERARTGRAFIGFSPRVDESNSRPAAHLAEVKQPAMSKARSPCSHSSNVIFTLVRQLPGARISSRRGRGDVDSQCSESMVGDPRARAVYRQGSVKCTPFFLNSASNWPQDAASGGAVGSVGENYRIKYSGIGEVLMAVSTVSPRTYSASRLRPVEPRTMMSEPHSSAYFTK